MTWPVSMVKMLRIPPVKSLISLAHTLCVRYSSGLTKKQLLRIRAEQKQLYGRIIRGDTEQGTESVKKTEKEEGEAEIEKESVASVTADCKASAPSKSSEFYWQIQRGDSKNVKIFQSKDVKFGRDVSTKDETSWQTVFQLKFPSSKSLPKNSWCDDDDDGKFEWCFW